MARQRSAGAKGKGIPLTPREKQVIALVLAGYTSKEGARRIGVSEHRFKQHLADIITKLGVSNQLELVLFALHHHLTGPLRIPSRVIEKPLSQKPRPKHAA